MMSLPVIAATSPSLAEAMRGCKLRAGLSRCASLQPFVLGNPKAWLGTAYHKVMEELPAILQASDPLAIADQVWNAEISRLEQEVAGHPLNARFGPATTWKSYFLVHATLRLRIEDASAAWKPSSPTAGGSPPPVAREVEITAAQGKLRGKIDMLSGEDLIDFKTGEIFEEDEITGSISVKQAYVRQMRIYAWLAHASTGRWVKRGLLYPLAGAPVEVPIVPAECEAEAYEALSLLDSYNAAVTAGNGLVTMGSPSPDACRWCTFKPTCPTFWQAVTPDWSGLLDGEVIRGTIAALPQSLLVPGTYSLIVNVLGGTVPAGTSVRLAPLSAGIHTVLTGLTIGQTVVLSRIGRKASGSLYPISQTVMLTSQQIASVFSSN